MVFSILNRKKSRKIRFNYYFLRILPIIFSKTIDKSFKKMYYLYCLLLNLFAMAKVIENDSKILRKCTEHSTVRRCEDWKTT